MVRLETLRTEQALPTVDCVLARALAPLPLLLDYAEPFLARGAVGLFHKGQDIDVELTEATKYWKLNITKHASLCDSRGVILQVHEAIRV
jgi:16S rRNA (guanine527-N7)-methyltransferase